MKKTSDPINISQLSQNRLKLHEYIPLATPLGVYLELSGICNLRCKFCPQGVGGHFKKDILSIETFEKLLLDLSKFKNKIKLLRVCGNGEPLINKNVVEIYRRAKESGLFKKIELVTNGILFNKYLIDNLPPYLDKIIISVEGLSSQEYLRISNVKIDFYKFLNNLKALYNNRGNCKIHIKITNEAVPTKKERLNFFKLFGDRCDEIYIENLVPMWPQYNTAFSTDKHRYGKRLIKHKVCVQIFKNVQIQADGEVLPCCVDWNRCNLLGNIKDEPLLDIWNGEKLRNLRRNHLKGNKNKLIVCKDCTLNDYCDVDNVDRYRNNIIKRL